MKDIDSTSTVWRKSTYSGGASGQCVEVAALPRAIGIRDSKNPHQPALTMHPRAFGRLLRGVEIA